MSNATCMNSYVFFIFQVFFTLFLQSAVTHEHSVFKMHQNNFHSDIPHVIQTSIETTRANVINILNSGNWSDLLLARLKNEINCRQREDKAIYEIHLATFLYHVRQSRNIHDRRRRRDLSEAVAETKSSSVNSKNIKAISSKRSHTVQMQAKVTLDGQDLWNINKTSEKASMENSTEIIKADIGDTEIQLNMRMTVRRKSAYRNDNVTSSSRSKDSDYAGKNSQSNLTNTGNNSASKDVEGESKPTAKSKMDEKPISPGSPFHSRGKYDDETKEDEESQPLKLQSKQRRCPDKGWCFFDGECILYEVLDMKLCKCKSGTKGSRCENFDILEVLGVLAKAEKDNYLDGNLTESSLVKDDSLSSVVDSISLYLTRIPNIEDTPYIDATTKRNERESKNLRT